VIPGLLLAMTCGLCWGVFLAPMRLLKAWEWENIWAVWTVFAMLLVPVAVASLVVPHFVEINKTVGPEVLFFTCAIGAVSGTAGFLFSYTVPVVGVGLASALNAGGSMAVSLFPLVILHSKTIAHRSGMLTIAGVALSIWGLWFCGKGGSLRDKEAAAQEITPVHKVRLTFPQCVAANIFAGAISSGMNVVLAFPNPIVDVAHHFGSTDFQTATAFLAPYLAGGFLTNIFYCAYVLRKNRTTSRFLAPSSSGYFIWVFFMAVVFDVGTISYAYAVGLLGSFGAIITWGVSGAAMIVFPTIWDSLLGQWRGLAARQMTYGVLVLMASIMVLALAQYFYQLNPLG
jgi:L-rhamnose-H+ transport protein